MSRLTLSAKSQKWVEARMLDGSFANEDEYFDSLVRRDMATLLAELKKGEESGTCQQSLEEIVAEAKQDYIASKNG